MARIQIRDLPKNLELSEDEVRKIWGDPPLIFQAQGAMRKRH